MKTKEKIGRGALLVTDGNLKYIEFECLNQYRDVLVHCMSTRIGGFSTGECSSLNLGFKKNDSRDSVERNFKLLCESVGFDPGSLVLTDQVHETFVRNVDTNDMGKGFFRESDLSGTDGLLTQAEGVTMVTFHADCIPLFLFEPGVRAAALLHSGWRGTLKGIASEAMKKLSVIPGFMPERLIAVVGPSIGSCCFEVGEEVCSLFRSKYGDSSFFTSLQDGKWKLDLPGLLKAELVEMGMQEDNVHISGICTKCRNDLFFSHRGDNGRTGSLAAFMQLKQPAVRSNV